MWKPTLENTDTPISRRIIQQMETDIRAGRLAPGAQLPTQRDLAAFLGISLGTVTRAYNEARERGLIEGTTGRGTFVSLRHQAPEASSTAEISAEHLVNLGHNTFFPSSLDSSLRALAGQLGDVHRMTDILHRYQPLNGQAWHRQVGAGWLSRPEWTVDPDQVVLCAGAQHALFVSLATLAEPGDTVMCEQVVYPGLKRATRLLHLPTRGLAMDEEGVLPEAIDEAARETGSKLLYVVPTFQNPTGALMSNQRRERIAETALRRGVTVIEDDVYGYLADPPLPSIASLMPAASYFCASLSKCAAAGLRVGYLVCPRAHVPRAAETVCATMAQAPSLTAEAASHWIQDGTVRRMILANRGELRARHEMAAGIFPIAPTPPSGASGSLWVHLPLHWETAERFVAAARAKGVLVSGAADFHVGTAPAPRAVRICFGPEPSRARCARALAILAELIENPPAPSMTVA